MEKNFFVLFVLMGLLLFSTPPKTSISPVKTTDLTKVSEDAILIGDSNSDQGIQAEGKDILISGDKNTIHFTGICQKLVITGKYNDIDVDTVSAIVITGNYNFVSWKLGTNAKAKPVITDKGGYNNVGKRSGQALSRDDN